MSELSVRSPLAPSSIAIAFAVLISLAWLTAGVSHHILRPLLDIEAIRGTPFVRYGFVMLGNTIVMLALTSLAARTRPDALLALAGLGASPWRPALWAVLVLVPSYALCFTFGPLDEFRASDILAWSVASPFIEEVIFRGLAVGILMRLCGWPFLAAALLPAAFFGIVHMAQGEGPMEIAGVVAITGLGGLLFGWLFVRWDFNLWPPIFLHMGMNALWHVFDLGDNAIGGWFGNAQRLLIVALAIVLTLLLAPRRNRSAQ